MENFSLYWRYESIVMVFYCKLFIRQILVSLCKIAFKWGGVLQTGSQYKLVRGNKEASVLFRAV